jgi:hypothetical protein
VDASQLGNSVPTITLHSTTAPYGQQEPPFGQQTLSTSETHSDVQPNVVSQQVGIGASTPSC